MMRARHYRVTGRVQGVGYRAFAVDAARAEGLRGWVRNRADGAVEAHAEGDAEALSRFEWRLWQGPPGSRVEDVETEDVLAEAPDGFHVRS